MGGGRGDQFSSERRRRTCTRGRLVLKTPLPKRGKKKKKERTAGPQSATEREKGREGEQGAREKGGDIIVP